VLTSKLYQCVVINAKTPAEGRRESESEGLGPAGCGAAGNSPALRHRVTRAIALSATSHAVPVATVDLEFGPEGPEDSLKGGDPATASATATLLRLHPNHQSHLRHLPPLRFLRGWPSDFGCYRLSWCDGRCVQGPGTYSMRHADPHLLAIPTSWRRVAASNPN
jgi:hypothetical protein